MAKLHRTVESVRVHDEIMETLSTCGLPYELKTGRKHIHIKLMGRLVGILPRSSNDKVFDRAHKNVLSQIRRAAYFLREDPTWVGRV
jgi:hypothetical protein